MLLFHYTFHFDMLYMLYDFDGCFTQDIDSRASKLIRANDHRCASLVRVDRDQIMTYMTIRM